MAAVTLLIGGSPLMVSIYNAILRDLGSRVVNAISTKEITSSLNQRQGPDLIIVDLSSSEQSPVLALEAMGLRPGPDAPPILVVVGNAPAGCEPMAPTSSNRITLVRRPFRIDEFVALVRHHLSSAAVATPHSPEDKDAPPRTAASPPGFGRPHDARLPEVPSPVPGETSAAVRDKVGMAERMSLNG